MGTIDAQALAGAAICHLCLHFTPMHNLYADAMRLITRGDGPYVIDHTGRRVLDFLSGLSTVQIGYSHGGEIGQAALAQLREQVSPPLMCTREHIDEAVAIFDEVRPRAWELMHGAAA